MCKQKGGAGFRNSSKKLWALALRILLSSFLLKWSVATNIPAATWGHEARRWTGRIDDRRHGQKEVGSPGLRNPMTRPRQLNSGLFYMREK
jgi:hypothetical protein